MQARNPTDQHATMTSVQDHHRLGCRRRGLGSTSGRPDASQTRTRPDVLNVCDNPDHRLTAGRSLTEDLRALQLAAGAS